MAVIKKVTLPSGDSYDVSTLSIPFGQVDNSSTATVFTATIDGITELYDGVCVYLKNGVVTSASGWTLNINGLGAKPVYQSMAAAGRTTTVFNVAYTGLFIYNSSRVEGGCWDYFYGHNSDNNTLAYQVRVNQAINTVYSQLARYMICFSRFDGTLLPATGVGNSTGTSKALTTESFNPFGTIFYYSYTTVIAAGGAPGASYMWIFYPTVDLRYSFNSGSTLTAKEEVYVKCVPQSDGSVKLAGNDCITCTLPSTDDGYVYIYLGKAYDTYRITLDINHPVYYYKDGAIREWTNRDSDVLVVNIEESNGSIVADKTQTEVSTAIADGKVVIGQFNGSTLPYDGIYFIDNAPDGSYPYCIKYSYNTENTLEQNTFTYTSTDELNNSLSNYLSKFNTTAYTPTANYHPATKKYVDDNIPTKVSDLTNDSGFLTDSSTLDATKLSGTVPTASLPSYVDDVLEYSAKSAFPASGETGKIYVDTSTNLTYRWGGSAYVEISPSLALGNTSSTAFRGDYGEAAYTHAVTNKGSAFANGLYKITTNSEGHVTGATAVQKSDITGLGIPAQDTTYTFDGTYNASSNKAATVSTVTNAINALDGGTIGEPGSGKTITVLSQENGNVSATFGDISITKSQISDMPTLGTAASRNVTSTYDPTDTDDVLTGSAVSSALSTVAPLVITITSTTSEDVTTYSANRTYAQIGTAYANSRPSFVLYDNVIYNLDSFKSSLSKYCFTRTYEDDNGAYLDQFTISASNLVSHSSTELVREDDMYQYTRTSNIAYDNCNTDGSYGTTAKITYTEGTLFWYGKHQLGRATTDITHGDTLTLNTNYVATTIANEFKRLPDIINSLIAAALAEYDDGDTLSYGNTEES